MIYVHTETTLKGPFSINQFHKLFKSGRIHPSLTLVRIVKSKKVCEAREVMHAITEVELELGLPVKNIPERILKKAIYQLFAVSFDSRPRKPSIKKVA